jgi:hypothetical protein
MKTSKRKLLKITMRKMQKMVQIQIQINKKAGKANFKKI